MADTTITIVEEETEVEPTGTTATQTPETAGALVPHTHVTPRPNSSLTLSFNFNPMEDSRRIIANNLSSIGGEISPLISLSRSRPALSLQEWLNPSHQRQVPIQTLANEHNDAVVINMDHPTNFNNETTPPSSNDHQHNSFNESFVNTANQNNNNNNNNNNNGADPNTQVLTLSTESRRAHKNLESYFTFLLILLTKFAYDNRAEILNFILLVITFVQANNDLKKEITKQKNRRLIALLGIICYIIGCFVFINFVFKEPIFFSYKPPVTISQLLWTVAISDYILKLITVVVKVLFTCLPEKIVAFQNRGKYYLMMEATSQLYRCGAPLMPWLQYLYYIYEGPDKALGIVLFIMYITYKASDNMSYVKQFFEAGRKMFQNASLGTTPSKDQIVAAGGLCAICHEEYSTPVRLSCKHIFCESCVTTWLDRERSCPLCRASITDDPIYRDGHTTHFVQLY